MEMCDCKAKKAMANRKWRIKNPDYEVSEKRREYKRLWNQKKKALRKQVNLNDNQTVS